MIYPVAELKILSFNSGPAQTVVRLRLSRIDSERAVIGPYPATAYARVVLAEREVTLDAGWNAERVLVAARARLVPMAAERGVVLPADRLICTL